MCNWISFRSERELQKEHFLHAIFPLLFVVFIALIGCGGGSNGDSGTSGAPPSGLLYASSSIVATVGQLFSSGAPAVTGTVSRYTINPALPSGLTINVGTGVISGTATSVSPKTSYVVTAANDFGSTTATLQITISPASTPAASTLSETFSTGITPCWTGGPAACTQTWANYNGAPITQSIIAAPFSGWNHPRILKIPAAAGSPTVYSTGTIPYASPGTIKGDVTVEFSYDSTGFSPAGIFFLNANIDDLPFYQIGLDGAGNCILAGGDSTPCPPNQRHLLHAHFDAASSYDQIDGSSQHTFTANSANPFSQVSLVGNSGTNVYFGDISVAFDGFSSCLNSPQILLEALGSGSLSAGELNVGTHGGNSRDGWNPQPIYAMSFDFVAGGSAFSQPVTVCGKSYSGNSGNAIRMTMPAATASAGYWEIGQFTTFVGYSVGFGWSYTSSGLNNGVDFFAIGDTSGAISNLQLDIIGSAQRICIENDFDTSQGSPCIPVDVSPSTSYWLTFGTSATGDDTVYLYSYPGMSLLGSVRINPNGRPAQVGEAVFKLGKTGSETIDHDMTMDFWNVLMDITGGKVPLLPQ